MALQKEKQIKQAVINAYFKIVDCDVKNGLVFLAPFANAQASQNRRNMLDKRIKVRKLTNDEVMVEML